MPQQFRDRIETAASKATGLDTGPSEPMVWKILQMLSPVPIDPDFYKNESRENIFMNTVPPVAIGGMMSKFIKPTANATEGLIKADPYGLKEGPMERRVFLDRILGNTTQRGLKKSNELFNAPEYLETQEGFQKAADFAESVNKKYGWPNAINNPEKIGNPMYDERMDQTLGPIMKLFNLLKEGR